MIYLHFKILMTSELSSMGRKGFLLSSELFQKWRLGMAKNFPRIGSKVWKNTQRVNARAPERGRAVDGRLRAGPGLSQRSFAVRSLLPPHPQHRAHRAHAQGAQEQGWPVESVCLQNNEAFVFGHFGFFCQYVAKYMNLKVQGRTKKWQKLRSYKP